MKYNKIYDEIIEIPNFLSKKDCEIIVKIIETVPESSWEKTNDQNWNKRNLFFVDDKKLIFYQKVIEKKIFNLFDSYLNITGNTVHRILQNTGGITEHIDNGTELDIVYGLVLYYNDNYDDGEIEYPNLEITHKPKAGSLIIHNAEYSHKVREVTSGTRYMTTFFVYGNEENPAKIKNLEDL
jgi:predicted 2-oxoglutarate/Fe(II)-dependent dioxygenase YbiX